MTTNKKSAGWGETPPVDKPEDVEVEEIKSLKFSTNGWCPELKKSYRVGTCTPKTMEDYEALKKYADKG